MTLGLNEKEATEIAEALKIPVKDHSPDGLAAVVFSGPPEAV